MCLCQNWHDLEELILLISTLVSLLTANTDDGLIGLTDNTEYLCLPALLGFSQAKI